MMNVKEYITSLNRYMLTEDEVKQILIEYDIPTTKFVVIKDCGDITDLSLSYPVAVKICSPRILHKTDVDGIKLNVRNYAELVDIIADMNERFSNERILIEPMEKPGIELIIGLLNDKTFGMTLMTGLGGIFTEIYKDVSFRVIPISRYDAEQMLNDLKASKILDGYRGIKVNRTIIIDILLRTSKLGVDLAEYIDQMDLNPVFVRENDAVVVDAKMILKRKVQI
jgi:acyl-CoA synthetase (NDP forming)